MTITGKYNKDSNFTYIYTDDTLYTIPHNASKDWSYIKVGQRGGDNNILDRETFEEWKAKCTKEGTFELSE